MSTSETDASAPAAKEDTPGETDNNKEAKKKRVINVPPCPPEVSTAFLLLRGALMQVLGSSMDQMTTSLLQATYLKEKRLSGKFGVSFGKKVGSCQIPCDVAHEDAILDAVGRAANRMLLDDAMMNISTLSVPKSTAVDRFGKGVLDGSHNKTKPDQDITMAYIPNVVLATVPSVPLASAKSSIASIVLERGDMNCNVAGGKKARKAEVTIKFVVTAKDGGDKTLASPMAAELDPQRDLAPLKENKVRGPEGEALLKQVQEAAKEEEKQKEEEEAKHQAASQEAEEEMVVDPFQVKGIVDYDKLVCQFGSTLIHDETLQQLQAKSKIPLHRFLRRGIFFSHRDLQLVLQDLDRGIPFYLYTGRGPSSQAMHLGHLIPFLMTKWFQQAFDVPLVIQMTDDEKFLFKGQYDEFTGDNLEHFQQLTMENARDIIACGFDFSKTFIFSDLDYVGRMYPNILRIWKAVTTNTVQGIFGFDGTSNIGKVAFPAVQAAPSFASSFPIVLNAPDRTGTMNCLIPCAIDQDPYFRMTRDVAHKLVLSPKQQQTLQKQKQGSKEKETATKSTSLAGKPALIHSKFFPPLQGASGKMSSSDFNSAIFLTDTQQDIANKIKHHAFSGGQETKALQEELGANLEVDVSFQWLRFFLEDDEELAKIERDYGSGQGEYWGVGQVKAKLIKVLQELVAEHQARRAKITDEEVRKWMAERCIL